MESLKIARCQLSAVGASLEWGLKAETGGASLAQGTWSEVGSLESEREIGKLFYMRLRHQEELLAVSY